MSLEFLAENMPVYTEKDLAVCHRRTPLGIWKCELWTKRDFKPLELAFAPLSSQIKETHLHLNANCIVGLPSHGPGAHPDNGFLALDGRTRTSLAHENLVDNQAHRGNLFWLVQRVADENLGNMVLEPSSWSCKVNLALPWQKGRAALCRKEERLPSIPVLLNKQDIKAHERLSVYVPPAKKEEGRNID